MTSNLKTILACVLLGGLTMGCTTDANPVLIILQNQVPSGPPECAYAAEPQEFLASGLLDLAGGQAYIFAPSIRNEAQMNDDFDARNEVQLLGADITIEYVNTERSFALFEALEAADAVSRSQRFSGRVSPGGTTTVTFPIVDSEQASILANALPSGAESQIVARVKVFGVINGGDIESGVYEYPITLCEGCMPALPMPTEDDPEPMLDRCYAYQF